MSPQFRIIVIFLALIFLLAPLNGIIFAEEKTAPETTLAPESTTSTTEEPGKVEIEIASKWKCPYCGQVNSSDDTICVFCHHQKPADAQIIIKEVSPQIKIETEEGEKNLKWRCTKCGEYNNFGATKCFYCEEPRPPTTSSDYQLFYPLYHNPTMHNVSKGMIEGGSIAIAGSIALIVLGPYLEKGSEMPGLIAFVIGLPATIAGGVVVVVGAALYVKSMNSLDMIPVKASDIKDLGCNSLDNYRLLTEHPTLPRSDITIFKFGFTF